MLPRFSLAWRAPAPSPGPFAFRPPMNSRWLTALVQSLCPLILRVALRVKRVDIEGDGLDRLRQLGSHRVILTPNHPNGYDPVILFDLSRRLGRAFNFIAAKEVFTGARGRLAQRLGAYSVVRGSADRESFRMTRQLLAEGKRWLVVFPEGETYGQNDLVMPFQQGVVQMAFWGLEELAKQYSELPPLFATPIAMKYLYESDMRGEISDALSRLEQKLSLDSPESLSLYGRLRRAGETLLGSAEKQYGLRPDQNASLEERILNMREMIFRRVSERLGVTFRPEQPAHQRVHELVNVWERWVYEEPQSDYERDLQRRRASEIHSLYDDIYRVRRFIALHDGYVGETRTAERFLDVIARFEMEVFGETRARGPRRVVLRVGDPVNLSGSFERYKKDKRATLLEVTASLESSVKGMLAEMERYAVAIE